MNIFDRPIREGVQQYLARIPGHLTCDNSKHLRRAVSYTQDFLQANVGSASVGPLSATHYAIGLLQLSLQDAEVAECLSEKYDLRDNEVRDQLPFWHTITAGADDNRAEHLAQALDQFEMAATLCAKPELHLRAARANDRAGFVLLLTTSRYNPEPAQKALKYFERAERLFADMKDSTQQASALGGLALAHLCLATWGADTVDHGTHLESTKRYLAQAHALLTPGNGPISEARSAILLGDAYRALPEGVSVAQVTAAIKCYQDGLRTCSRDKSPLAYALLNQRLGRIYEKLSDAEAGRGGTPRLLELSFGRAMRMDKDPRVWTAEQRRELLRDAQYFAAMDYRGLDLVEEAKIYARKLQAAEALQEALKVCSPTKLPEVYARIQVDLGEVCERMPLGDDSIGDPIDCYQKALEVYTPEAAPAMNRELRRRITGIQAYYRDLQEQEREFEREMAGVADSDAEAQSWGYGSWEAFRDTLPD